MLKNSRWRECLIATIGVWLVMAPSVLGIESNRLATCHFYAVGGVLVGFFLITAWRLTDRGESLIYVLVGLWLAVSPYPLGLTELTKVLVTSVATGVSVVLIAVWQLARP